MNIVVLLITFSTLMIMGALAWLVSKRLPEEDALSIESKIEDLVPFHTQHFPQLRQALESADSRYVRQNATAALHRTWREERRQILRSFLAGLAEDFARLDRLSRIVASLTPHFSRREELERIWLSLRFRLTYRVVSLRISAGGAATARELNYLATLVGSLSAHAEAGMIQMQGRSPA
jgi:hypothetical protein